MRDVTLSEVVPGLGGPSPEPITRRSQVRARERRSRRRRRRSLLAVVLALAVVGGGGYAAYAGLAPLIARLTAPNDFAGPGAGEVTVEIVGGDSGRSIGSTLVRVGVVKTVSAFVDAYSAEPRSGSIQPGLYRLRRQMKSSGALALLLQPSSRLQVMVTIPEGKRAAQILDILAKSLGLDRRALEAATRPSGVAALGLPAAAGGKVEGYLFPSTYEFRPGTSAAEVLRTMVQRGVDERSQLGIPAGREREVVTLAALVQAEAGKTADMGPVARVFVNRLKIGMKLQSDATVSYAANHFGITTSDAERALRSPYNTYAVTGLPAGPIDCPGVAALRAALSPSPGPWLYFVTVNPDTGETRFGTTTADKAALDAQWNAWLRAHPNRR
jgi:UPF0755 protein